MMNTLKAQIKELSNTQRDLKNQRKTVNLVGERRLQPWQAAYNHQVNREELRILHAAYGVLRGKTFSQIENHYGEDNHPLNQYLNQINKLVEKYEAEFVRTGEQAA